MLKRVSAKGQASSDPDVLRRAEKLTLPGVGAFDPGMRKLKEVGLVPLLNELVLEKNPGDWPVPGDTVDDEGQRRGNRSRQRSRQMR
jgi:hypothetical protein